MLKFIRYSNEVFITLSDTKPIKIEMNQSKTTIFVCVFLRFSSSHFLILR